MPGASSILRRYSPKKLIKLTNFIGNKYNLPVLLCGAVEDKKTCSEIMNKSYTHIIDYSGKINMNQLINYIGNAKLVIVGDTCGVHIAVATKTPVVCIGTGIFYGRFLPYPERYNNFKLCLPPFYFKNFHGLINLIKTKKIKEAIGELI
jgi:ADP-heptose:LPS heptosyltransferase